jgi:hypothetical protein
MAAGTLDAHTGRVLIDAERWLMSKESARYADKTVSEITGRDGGPVTIASQWDEIELARRAAFLLGRGMQQLEALRAQKLIEGKASGRRPA